MHQKFLPAVLAVLFCAAGAEAQSLELAGAVNTGLKASYQNGTVSFWSNAQNTSVVGDTPVLGTYGGLTATVTSPYYGATINASLSGNASSSLSNAYGWYRPLDWMTISAGTSNANPFSSVDNGSEAKSFAGPGVAAMVDLSPLQFGGVVASQAGGTGKSPNLALTGAVRVALPGLVTFNGTLGTSETIWLDWYHASVALNAIPGLVINGGYSAQGIDGAYTDSGNGGIAFALTPEVTVGAYGVYIGPFTKTPYWDFNGGLSWAIAQGLSLTAKFSGESRTNPNSTGSLAFTYQPYQKVSVTMEMDYATNPTNAAIALPLTSANIDFTFSL